LISHVSELMFLNIVSRRRREEEKLYYRQCLYYCVIWLRKYSDSR
jgi:hypothetical protein